MKKGLLIIFGFVLLIGVTACSNNQTETDILEHLTKNNCMLDIYENLLPMPDAFTAMHNLKYSYSYSFGSIIRCEGFSFLRLYRAWLEDGSIEAQTKAIQNSSNEDLVYYYCEDEFAGDHDCVEINTTELSNHHRSEMLYEGLRIALRQLELTEKEIAEILYDYIRAIFEPE